MSLCAALNLATICGLAPLASLPVVRTTLTGPAVLASGLGEPQADIARSASAAVAMTKRRDALRVMLCLLRGFLDPSIWPAVRAVKKDCAAARPPLRG